MNKEKTKDIRFDNQELNKNYNTNSIDVPIWERYLLTIEEASLLFRIGRNKLYRLAEENITSNWVLMNGNRILIKRKQFESLIDKQNSI